VDKLISRLVIAEEKLNELGNRSEKKNLDTDPER
jgi:hypothetical protein